MRVKNKSRPRVCDVLAKGRAMPDVRGLEYRGHIFPINDLERFGLMPRGLVSYGYASKGNDAASAAGHFRGRRRWPMPLIAYHGIYSNACMRWMVHGDPVYSVWGIGHRPRSRHIHRRPRPQGRRFRRQQVEGLVAAGMDLADAAERVRAFHQERR